MTAVPSQPPIRNTSGSTTDYKTGPLANSGFGNPAFYHQFYDDFDLLLGPTGAYTLSHTTAGTAAHAAGDGGLALLSTTAATNDAVSIQLPAASFSLPATTLAGKKLFYGVRLQLSDITLSNFVAGLINTTTTPLTGGSITDGAYFQKASGGTVLNFITATGSVLTTTPIPIASYTLANATFIDMAFYLNPKSEFEVFIGSQLFGWIPESGTGVLLPVRGPCLRLTPGLSPANLNMTLALSAGAAAIKTMTVDFHFAQKER